MFQRKMIFVAVVGALGAGATGAYAQAPSGSDPKIDKTQVGNVEIYGFLYPEFTVTSATSGTTGSSSTLATAPTTTAGLPSRSSIDASNSRLGFRGKEDLGDGLSAIWQIESTVPLDQGGGVLASRDSFVGLKGGFGTVRLGQMETVYKTLGDPIKTLNLGSGNFISASNILSSRQPFNPGGAASSAGSFHLRQPNSVLYNSPNLSGFQAHVMYSPDETRAAGINNANLQSYGVTYRSKSLYLALAYEVHNDFFGGSGGLGASPIANNITGKGVSPSHSKDTSPRATIRYTWDKTRVALDVTTIDFKESGQAVAGKFQDYKNTRYNLAWEQRWGTPWRSLVQYTSASAGSCSLTGGVACVTTGLEGNMLVAGGEYWFSKRTALFAFYAKLNNGSAATYNNMANVKTIAPGSDISSYAMGIRTNF